MSADWKIGDRALCVDGSPGEIAGFPGDDGFNVQKGVIYLVHCVFPTDGGRVFLSVRDREARMEQGWDQSRFRKIVPACDRQAVAQEREAVQ